MRGVAGSKSIVCELAVHIWGYSKVFDLATLPHILIYSFIQHMFLEYPQVPGMMLATRDR